MSKYGHLPLFVKPQCLIKTNDEGKLEAEDNILQQISNIEERLVVVAIVGIYRTGKSFLINRLANSNSGFPLGKTIESKTKGIWVWCRIHPTQEKTVLMLLDTEGLGDVKKGDVDHDNRVLTLSARLCNVLCYNILNAFDQNASERLASFLSSGIGRELDGISPELVVCVRDFCLDLEHKSADAYLESSLEAIDGVGEEVEKRNRSRDFIRNCFKNRRCFIFDRPADRNSIKSLDKITEAELTPDFVEDARKFATYVYDRYTYSASNDRTTNGLTFAFLTRHHVRCIGAGVVSQTHDALQKAYNQHNEERVHIVTESFKESVETISLPVLDSQRFDKMCNSQLEKCLTELQIHVRYDDDKLYERQAKAKIEKLINERKQKNMQLIKAFCNDKLNALYITLVGNEHDYHRIGGHVDYRSAMTSFKAEYRQQCNEADNSVKELALQNFLSRTQEDSVIRAEDRRLTEEDANRKKEQLRQQHERQRQEYIRLNKEREQAEKEMRERKRREQEEFFRRKEQERLEKLSKLEEENRRQRERVRCEMRRLEEERQRDREFREAERRRVQGEEKRRREEMERLQERKRAEARLEQERKNLEELRRLELAFGDSFITKIPFMFICPCCGKSHYL